VRTGSKAVTHGWWWGDRCGWRAAEVRREDRRVLKKKKKNNFTYKWVIYVVDEEERTLHVGPTCTLNPKPPSQREREGEGEGEGGRDWIHDFLRWGPRCHTLPSLRTSSVFYSKINYREGGGNKGEERRCQRSP